MVQMYFDRETDIDHRQKRDEGFGERMPLLRAAIAQSTRENDPTLQAAFAHWIASLKRRIAAMRPVSLKLPEELQRARGLEHPQVSLRQNDALFARIKGEDVLLYPLPVEKS